MNESRYRLRGSTQRNGMAATSWQSWLVVARSITEAQAERPSHKRRRPIEGLTSGEAASTDAAAAAEASPEGDNRKTRSAQPAAKRTKPPAQASACTCSVSFGSTAKG